MSSKRLKFRPIPILTDCDLQRFWSKVNRRNLNQCWEWTAALNKYGYGVFSIDSHQYKANRVSYAIVNGDPGKINVCHTCDNPACVNPKHLWIGTQKDNMGDASDKGRISHGIRNGTAKLTEKQVKEILASDDSYKILSGRYGVCQTSISDIKTGKNWKRVEGKRHETIVYANSTTKVRGVSFDTRIGKYSARVFKGKNYYLGCFDTVEEAEQAAIKKRLELRGEA